MGQIRIQDISLDPVNHSPDLVNLDPDPDNTSRIRNSQEKNVGTGAGTARRKNISSEIWLFREVGTCVIFFLYSN